MPHASRWEQTPGWERGALPLAAACPGVAIASRTLARCGVGPQMPQSATRVHAGFLSLSGTGSASRPGGQQRAPISHQDPQHLWSVGTADASCGASAAHPQVLAPLEPPCAVGQIQATGSSTTASPADGSGIRRGANAGKGAGLPKILPGGEGR